MSETFDITSFVNVTPGDFEVVDKAPDIAFLRTGTIAINPTAPYLVFYAEAGQGQQVATTMRGQWRASPSHSWVTIKGDPSASLNGRPLMTVLIVFRAVWMNGHVTDQFFGWPKNNPAHLTFHNPYPQIRWVQLGLIANDNVHADNENHPSDPASITIG